MDDYCCVGSFYLVSFLEAEGAKQENCCLMVQSQTELLAYHNGCTKGAIYDSGFAYYGPQEGE